MGQILTAAYTHLVSTLRLSYCRPVVSNSQRKSNVFSTVRLFIKTGIGFLVAGLLLGGYILIQRELYGRFADPHLASAHAHAVFVGFVMFMILGVALWLFPRAPKDDTRYQPRIVTASYWLLASSTGAA